METNKKIDLNDRQLRAIELLCEGEKTLEQIAEDPGVHISVRQFNRWRYENELFKQKWHEVSVIYESDTLDEMKLRIPDIMKEHMKVVMQDKDLTAKMRAISIWQDRCMGTPTKKIESITATNSEHIHSDDMDKEIDEFDNDIKEEEFEN